MTQTTEARPVTAATLASDLATAAAAAQREHERHDAQVLELVGADDQAGLQKSRASLSAADAKVEDIRRAQAAFNAKQNAAQDIDAAKKRAQAWSVVERLLRERHAIADSLQVDLGDAMSSLHELSELTQRVYEAIPEADRPVFRPIATTEGALVKSVELYLYSRSGGKLCQQGMSPHSAEQRPDIVQSSKQLAEFILSRRSQQ